MKSRKSHYEITSYLFAYKLSILYTRYSNVIDFDMYKNYGPTKSPNTSKADPKDTQRSLEIYFMDVSVLSLSQFLTSS